jgi:hypothetical protein
MSLSSALLLQHVVVCAAYESLAGCIIAVRCQFRRLAATLHVTEHDAFHAAACTFGRCSSVIEYGMLYEICLDAASRLSSCLLGPIN